MTILGKSNNNYSTKTKTTSIQLGFDLIVISLVDWDVGYARIKIKTMLSCGQVKMLIQNNK